MALRFVGFCTLLLLGATPLSAQEEKAAAPASPTANPQPDSRFTASDLFNLEVAVDPQISPDGRQIAYIRRANDIMRDAPRGTIWLVDVASGKERPIAAGEASYSSPRWSRDGGKLAYVSAEAGSGPEIYVRWMDSGEAVRVSTLPSAPRSLSWSPDGSQIAFTMQVQGEGLKLGKPKTKKPEGAKWAKPLEIYDLLTYRADGAGYLKPGFTKIFTVPATGGSARQLTFGDYHDNGPLNWSPDGNSIYFSANRQPGWENDPLESELFKLDIASGALSQLTSRNGPDGSPTLSPDGKTLAFIGFDDQELGYHNAQLYLIDAQGGTPRSLTANFDRSIGSVQWNGDGRALYAQYDDHGETKVARISRDGSRRDLFTGLSGAAFDRPYTGGSFSVANNGTIAFTGGSATRPADVMVYAGGNKRRLTNLNATMVATKRLGEVRKFTTTSSHDGREIEAWITLPPDYVEGQKVPMILEIHGGPFAAYGPHFATDNQLYAAAGYAVISANPRGSTSYGAEFANEIHLAYPGNDYDDLISIVDQAIADGIVDPDRLFVTGGSGGGVLTSWIIGKTDRFKAAATQKPVINWTSQALTADGAAFFTRYWFGANPWEEPEKYWARSPLSLIGNVTTPTLVVVGSEDYRTPVSEAEQYYTALRLKGVPTAFVKVPGASHGGIAVRPSQSGAKAAAILAWFEKYKDGAEQSAD
ncbi:MAG: S9 family peptidase [Pseudomonadota bacterium]